MADFTTRVMIGFARLMEREAGHQLVCMALIVGGAVLYKMSIPKGEDLIVFALGVLGRSIGGGKSNEKQ